MKHEFIKDLPNGRLQVNRVFAAPLSAVWRAWTEAELLEQWWAPQPWKAVTQSMNFAAGGRWHYYMAGPEGEKHWTFMDFLEILPQTFIKTEDGFCDEAGNVTASELTSVWEIHFIAEAEQTTVRIMMQYANEAALKQIVEMGMEEGFTMGLNQLENLLQHG